MRDVGERVGDAGDQVAGRARAEAGAAGLPLLQHHVAHQGAVDVLGRDPQDVAGEPGGERADQVAKLG